LLEDDNGPLLQRLNYCGQIRQQKLELPLWLSIRAPPEQQDRRQSSAGKCQQSSKISIGRDKDAAFLGGPQKNLGV